MRPFLLISVLSATIMLTAGCGKSLNDKLKTMQHELDSLKTAGAPDSLITECEVLRFNAETNLQRKRSGDAKNDYEQALTILDELKQKFASSSAASKTKTDSLMAVFKNEASGLTELRKEVMDKYVKEIDSLGKAGIYLQAKAKAEELNGILPGLKQDEELSIKNKPLVVGSWDRTNRLKDDEIEKDYTETEKYVIRKDGSFDLQETRNGKDGPRLVWNYKYESYGTYTLNGDTVLFAINRVKGINKSKLLVDEQKKQWREAEDKPFDSLVTNNSQDRFLTLSRLKEIFKKR